MRTYVLGLAISLLLGAAYAFQNTGNVSVTFLSFAREFPQGLWEAALFTAGAGLMWIFSFIASFEIYSEGRSKVKELNGRVAKLEEEKAALLNAMKNIPSAREEQAGDDAGSESVATAVEKESEEL